jgi:hypothetical protein
MDPKAPPDPRRRNQLLHEIRLFFLKLGKLVTDQK